MSPRIPRRLARLASLLMLGGGALLLMADSSDCPDGYTAAKLDATFVSTCPGPDQGALHISLGAGSNADNSGLLRDLRAAGFNASGANVSASNGGDVCTPTTFQFTLASSGSSFHCQGIRLDVAHQEVTCDGSVRTPLVLQLGRRDLSDASLSDASSVSDAGDAGDASDAAAKPDASPVTPPDPPSTSTPPLSPVFTCKITFDRTAS